ncbi:hypothetical protein HDV63DRAFT_336189 [Trichoderma sp. SZMC 28014]
MTAHCNSKKHSSIFFSFFRLVTSAPGLRARAGKLGRQKSGPNTYGGESDSGRLQVHLTAPEAVKQTRYVNGPNCKEGEGWEKERKKRKKTKINNRIERKGTGLDYLLFNSVVCALT